MDYLSLLQRSQCPSTFENINRQVIYPVSMQGDALINDADPIWKDTGIVHANLPRPLIQTTQGRFQEFSMVVGPLFPNVGINFAFVLKLKVVRVAIWFPPIEFPALLEPTLLSTLKSNNLPSEFVSVCLMASSGAILKSKSVVPIVFYHVAREGRICTVRRRETGFAEWKVNVDCAYFGSYEHLPQAKQ